MLETIILSVLNHDSAVAAAAEGIVAAAGGRPVIEMGSRSTDAECGRVLGPRRLDRRLRHHLEPGGRAPLRDPDGGHGRPRLHLLYRDEQDAFAAQVAALGRGDHAAGRHLRHRRRRSAQAVAAAGPGLGAVRIDSGALGDEARRARRQLDGLGATEPGSW